MSFFATAQNLGTIPPQRFFAALRMTGSRAQNDRPCLPVILSGSEESRYHSLSEILSAAKNDRCKLACARRGWKREVEDAASTLIAGMPDTATMAFNDSLRHI
jgi:hypothetical protein